MPMGELGVTPVRVLSLSELMGELEDLSRDWHSRDQRAPSARACRYRVVREELHRRVAQARRR